MDESDAYEISKHTPLPPCW